MIWDGSPVLVRILWPDARQVDHKQIIAWAADDVANGKHAGPKPKDLQDAIAILTETGSVTLAQEWWK